MIQLRSSRLTSLFLDYFQELGGDVPRALERAQLRPEERGSEGTHVSEGTFARLVEHLVRESNDPLFGLNAAIASPRGAYGVVEYAMRASSTVGEAFADYARYQRLASESGHFMLIERQTEAVIDHVWNAPNEPWIRHVREGALAILLTLGREFTGKRLTLSSVWFSHDAPAQEQVSKLEEFFGCPIIFGRTRTGASFPATYFDEPIATADPVLRTYMLSLAKSQLAEIGAHGGVARDVERLLQKSVGPAQLQANEVAKQLGMSTRTLRRRLASEGTSVRHIESRVCRALCEKYLADPDVSVSQVATLLGFSSANAFGRAFTRWTGRKPSETRPPRNGAAPKGDPTPSAT
jgi:AraC-like DNA-binding protein